MRYNYNVRFDVVKNRRLFFTLSLIITAIGIASLLIFGLSTGVDFKAGTTIDVTAGQAIDKAKAEQLVKEAGQEVPSVTVGGERASLRFDKVLTEQEVAKIKSGFSGAYGDKVSFEENTVDTTMAKELAQKAIYSVLIASLGIIIYVAIRFEWRFGVAAILALLHDAFIVVSLFSIFRWEVNLPFLAAILTIIGYSINDTIVIFDRIRENMRFAKLKNFDDLAKLVNASVWQTMTRSINTVITVLVGAICLFIFGSESIRYFSLAIILGLFCGAYSSIFIASPLWLVMKNKSMKQGKLTPAKE
ncbi:protein translocase subunit SecF [Paenibacillus aurantius]|uniref:Protein-export membrane protein SecF n=1 Tax=Paenibacillus aurantius TaxID=2918900 RepID=A0AA96RJ96_9BACL|nr:protein translocase subunit SecF [Paenibacillus aurantius]WNQ13004.1 protein translocase subunit SecF [Paenibacillus aurantius]